jgi:acyl dehydratase
VVAARREVSGESLAPDEWRRGVHATHDLEVHRLVRAGDELSTVATIEAVEARSPGGYQVLRLDTVDDAGRPVATTRMGALFRGVAVDGDAAGTLVEPPTVEPTGRVRLATTPIPLSARAAHVYTETARIWNPIHTDVAAATRAGLAEPILHGTATLAMAVSEVVRVSAGGDPHRVRRIAARFGAMVALPSTITVRVLGSAPTDAGAAVGFEVANDAGGLAVSRGVVVLSV